MSILDVSNEKLAGLAYDLCCVTKEHQAAAALKDALKTLDHPVRALQLLHAEDDPNDALLCQDQLKRAGLAIHTDVVATREDFLRAVQTKLYDIVLTDYQLPGWSGTEVLRILRADGRDIPCILVTGSVGEEIAVKCIKLGATDYILKDRPARLPFAITSALEERGEREKSKEAERSRNRLASIVESSLDAIIGASEDGLIVNWNAGAANMFGFSGEEMYGRPFASLFAARSIEVGVPEGAAVTARKAIQRYESQGTKKSGALLDLAVTISPIWNSDGSTAGSSAIVRDVTEEKLRQREFLTAQKLEAIGQLAGGVAHDFNNLLTVINGYARMLQRKGSADPEKVDAIVQAGERGQRLTKQLLMFSSKQITQFKPLNLNVLIEGFLTMLRPLIGAHIQLRTILDPDLASVMADAGQMEQVVMNLVVNARDAMPDGGTITIKTATRSSGQTCDDFPTVTLSVADSGMGMSEQVRARIFEPFFTTKEVGRGTGLGLSTSLGIIAKCNGRVRVDTAIGRGTTFTIDLPACASSTAELENLSADGEVAARPGAATILLAEDDPTVRGFVSAVLEDRGYRVLATENGSKALDLCMTYPGPIHALVTDVVMPELNGRNLAERARVLRPNLKILFVSGYIDQGLKDEDICDAAHQFLEKPFTGEALLRVVEDLCTGVCPKEVR